MQRGFLREHGSIAVACYVIADLVAISAGGVLALQLRFGTVDVETSYRTAVVLGLLLALLIFPRFNLYDSWRGRNYAVHLRSLVMAWVLVGLGLVFIAYALKDSEKFSRVWFAYWGVFAGLFLVCGRSLATIGLGWLRGRGHNTRAIAVIGTGQTAVNVVERVGTAVGSGLRITCVFDYRTDSVAVPSVLVNIPVYPLDMSRIEQALRARAVDEVWICLPFSEQARIEDIIDALRQSTIRQRLVPDLTSVSFIRYPVTDIVGVSMLNLSVTPLSGISRLVKSVEDRVLAVLFGLLGSPVLILIALAVKMESKGPAIFKQRRHGSDGRPIKVYKFRTMVVHEEANGHVTQATKSDSRVTRVGGFLRRTSLDELPQLLNVLQGRMSIVGPRPHALAHNEFYKNKIESYMQRHKIKPGITGWAQVNGWRGRTDTLEKMQKRVEYDIYYIENWSLWFDLKIIVLTVFKGFVNKNAY